MRALQELHESLTVETATACLRHQGYRIARFKPQHRIFEPRQMRNLLCVRAGYSRPGRHLCYDDQHEMHCQLFEAEDGAAGYTSMRRAPRTPSGPSNAAAPTRRLVLASTSKGWQPYSFDTAEVR